MTWALQDAKAKFSEVMRRTLSEGPQFVTVRGRPTMVLLSQAEFDALTNRKHRKPLVELFRNSPIAGTRLDLKRSTDTGRDVDL